MQTFNLIEAVPLLSEDLQDLLVRQAYFEIRGKQLHEALKFSEAELKAVSETRPPFLIFQAKEVRQAFQTTNNELTKQVSDLRKAVELHEKIARHLQLRISGELDAWMRNVCGEYMTGLVSEQFVADWILALDRFSEIGKMLAARLGMARNTAAAGYDREKKTLSKAALEQLKLAYDLALEVEAQIKAVNAIADQHHRMLENTVFADPMPMIVEDPYALTIAQIEIRAPEQAQSEFDRVKAAVEDLLYRELAAFRERTAEAAKNHEVRKQSYLHSAWEALHAHATLHSIDETLLDSVVADVEKIFVSESSIRGAEARKPRR